MVSKHLASIFITSTLTYALILLLFVAFNLRAAIGTLQLATIIWFFGFIPIICATQGDFGLMFKLLSQNSTPKEDQTRPKFQQLAIMLAYGVCIGAFCLSVYVPLDHEGFLQIWPVAPAIGAMGGFCIAGLVGSLIIIAQ